MFFVSQHRMGESSAEDGPSLRFLKGTAKAYEKVGKCKGFKEKVSDAAGAFQDSRF